MTTYEEKQRIKATAAYVRQGYEAWREDMIASGKRPSEASQNQFAATMGMIPQALSRVLQGQSIPSAENLRRLADSPWIGKEIYIHAGLAPDSLDQRIAALIERDPDFAEFAAEWPLIDPNVRQRILEMAKRATARDGGWTTNNATTA